MCGIIGATGPDAAARAAAMNAVQFHRGPDDGGSFVDPAGGFAMAMRRLAILDVAGGAQPMHDPSNRYTIVYNGEILKAPKLRRDLEAAKAALGVNRLVVSTDDPEIAAVARALGAEIVMRPAELAADDTPTLRVLRHALAALGESPDAVLTLQPTRRAEHIEAAFAADATTDSLVSKIEVPYMFHPRSVMKRDARGYLVPYLDSAQPYRRQEKEMVFARNGAAIYITRTPRLAEYVFGGKLIGFPMDAESSLDIDVPEDLTRADAILRKRGA